MNTVKEVEKILSEAQIAEYKQEAKLIVTEISKLSYEDILLGKIENEDKIIEIAKKRAQTKEPIQYLLGCAYFMGEKYIVDKNVLIPRDDTEILVNSACELVKDTNKKIDILDIGTGTGCISIELAKRLNDVEILGVDVSKEAIHTAIENINLHNVIRKVILRKSDLFSNIRHEEKFDLIVSNPPYIPYKLKQTLQIEVQKEPDLALFAQNDGYYFYEKIITDAPKYLKTNGYIAFELGIGQFENVSKMLEKDFCDIKIIPDMQGIERVITAKLK